LKELITSNENNEEKKDSNDDKFTSVMKTFYEYASLKVNELQKHLETSLKDVQNLAELFGEQVKPNQFKVEEFLTVFNSFREQFQEAKIKVEESEERRAKEEKKKQAEEKRKLEKEETKRKKQEEKEQKAKIKEEKKNKNKEKCVLMKMKTRKIMQTMTMMIKILKTK